MVYDTAIVGGGPAGTTAATLLKKYAPDHKVIILEKEIFPRDHIGESQLPGISMVLEEMGVWDKVEAADFPIKLGSTNKWGKNPELWDFEFFPSDQFVDEPRPAQYQGQRRFTAFQVDRSIYDKILLDHAAECGVEVRQGTNVKTVLRTGDKIDGLVLDSGETIEARYYLDGSGNAGIIRKAMGIKTEYPTSLQNVAFWDYWQNAEWAVEIGVGGTKIQVMSVDFGWLWFIPLGPTRTSIGLVVPAAYYKKSGKRPEELYMEGLAADDRVSALIKNATRENRFAATKDWSFLSERHSGENWFLIGESGGFADPILSAGMTITHAAGREVAYTILELERGKMDPTWLKETYGRHQKERIRSHIRFADYWYTANTQFADLKEHIQGIAREVGLELEPDAAWRWIAQGGFVNESLTFSVGSFDLNGIRALGQFLSDLPTESPFDENNVFKLNLAGASWKESADYSEGRVRKLECYSRDGKVLPIDGSCGTIINVLQRSTDLSTIAGILDRGAATMHSDPARKNELMIRYFQALEAMVVDGWVEASHDPKRPRMKIKVDYRCLQLNKDTYQGKNSATV